MAVPLQAAQPNPIDVHIDLHACNWLNISACPTTVTLSKAGRGIMVVAYNPLAWGRVAALRVPVAGESSWAVEGKSPPPTPAPPPIAPGAAAVPLSTFAGSSARLPS